MPREGLRVVERHVREDLSALLARPRVPGLVDEVRQRVPGHELGHGVPEDVEEGLVAGQVALRGAPDVEERDQYGVALDVLKHFSRELNVLLWPVNKATKCPHFYNFIK